MTNPHLLLKAVSVATLGWALVAARPTLGRAQDYAAPSGAHSMAVTQAPRAQSLAKVIIVNKTPYFLRVFRKAVKRAEIPAGKSIVIYELEQNSYRYKLQFYDRRRLLKTLYKSLYVGRKGVRLTVLP